MSGQPVPTTEERVVALEQEVQLEQRLAAVENARREAQPPAKGGVSWWQSPRTVTQLTALIAGILPLMTFIDGGLRNWRETTRQVLEQQNTIRQTYLDRVFDPAVTEATQEKLFKLLSRMESDPELKAWATEELQETQQKLDELKSRKEDLEKQVLSDKEQIAQLSRQVQDLEQSTQTPAVNREIAEKEKEIGTIIGRFQQAQQSAAALGERVGENVVASPSTSLVYVQFRGGIARSVAESLRARLKTAGYDAPGVERLAGNYANEVRYFRPEDRESAQRVADLARSELEAHGCKPADFAPREMGAGLYKARPGQIEVWISTNCES